jgi:hypothetical protein
MTPAVLSVTSSPARPPAQRHCDAATIKAMAALEVAYLVVRGR